MFHGVAIGLVRRRTPRPVVIALSCGSVVLSFLIACYAFIELIGMPEGSRVLVDRLYTWFGAGIGATRFTADLALRVDPLSAVMTLVVTGVGLLIHVYSIGYMDDDHRDDRGFQRFFCYLNLFTFSMLVLVLADNLVLMFVGWEGVGLCSYLLIGFWYSDRHNAYCGSKAFIVNRIGDFGFLIGIFLLFASFVSAGVPAGVGFADISQHFVAIAERTIATPWGSDVAARRRDRAVPVRRRGRQVGADPALRLAARRDGRSDAGVGADPRGHDGHRGRLHGVPALVPVRGGAARERGDRVGRRADGALRGHDRARADRHQEGARLLHREPARLHVPRRGLRRATPARSSTSSRTRSSRRCCSSARAR